MGKWTNNIIQGVLETNPIDKWPIDIDDVKAEWKDFVDEDGNSLHEIFASITTDENYVQCMLKALMNFNYSLPQTDYLPSGFPDPYLWIKLSFVEVLDAMIMYHAANYFSGSSGGVNVPVHERVQILQGERNIRKQEAAERQRQLKTFLNMESAYGSIIPPGGYGNIYG